MAALDDVFSDDVAIPAGDGYPLAATLFLPRTIKRGHFGFFRPEHPNTLWRSAAEWLEGDR